MKKILLFLIVAGTYTHVNAQFGPEQIISTNADRAMGVFSVDIDGDNDIDIISASRFDNKIAWYENTDGLGTFGPEQVISNNVIDAFALYAGDIDSDGDTDVLSVSNTGSNVFWHENTDGLGTFGPEQIIGTPFGPNALFIIDLNGDDHLDVIVSSFQGSSISWFENIDGEGTFGPEQQILALNGAISVYAGDLDGDGDSDVLSASYNDNKIVWQQNMDGQGTFGDEIVISTEVIGASDVFVSDIDNDGDLDVLSTSALDNKLAWYENLDGMGNFGLQQIISSSVMDTFSVFAADLDNDSDMDVLCTSGLDDNKVSWFENTDGLGSFGSEQVISSNAVEARKVHANDLDGDGDIDVVSASREDDKIAWYRNQTILSVDENTFSDFVVYPNPAKDLIHISYSGNSEILNFKLFNILGEKLDVKFENGQINLSKFQSGNYIIEIQMETETFYKQIIKY